MNLQETIDTFKTKETESLLIRILAERFCVSESQLKQLNYYSFKVTPYLTNITGKYYFTICV